MPRPSHKPADVVYDVAFGWHRIGEDYFSQQIVAFCAEAGLSTFVVEPIWVEEFTAKLRRGRIGVRVLLDMASDCYFPGDPYYQLAVAAKTMGATVIDDPDLTPIVTHKGQFHSILLQNGIGVPETVIVPREGLESFRLTEDILERVGRPFVVKPGWGYGRQGVILHATSEADLLRCAEEVVHSDCFMVQKRVSPKRLGPHIAWFRVFYVFGEVIACWWEPPQNVYSLVTPSEREEYDLGFLEPMAREIARLAQLPFFSTEIAIPVDGPPVTVDYVNDQCDMHLKSYYPTGVPDAVVRRIAWLLAFNFVEIIQKRTLEEDLKVRDAIWQPPAEGAARM